MEENKEENIERNKVEENKNYDGWLVSNSFWKRAFAVWAHNFVAGFIISIGFFLLVAILTLIFGGSLMEMFNNN